MRDKLPVIAVVPAFNSAKTMGPLLRQLIDQKYDEIYVIDDASTDKTVQVAKSFGPKIKVIEGQDNVGSGANRNRIIGRTDKAILHFIDADMQLLSKGTPDIIRSIDWPPSTAFIGGMIRNPDGTQNPFNYGPRPHFFVSFFLGGLQFVIWMIGLANKPIGRFLRKAFTPALASFPPIYKIPKSRKVYWVAESNMLMRSDLFEHHGGYDPRFRYCEIEDLALRVYRSGKHGRFEPSIDAIHATNDNILKSREKRVVARKEFNKKHGRLVLLIPPLADYLAGLKTQKRYHK